MQESFLHQIGQALRSRREELGMTQEEAAQRLGMHRTYYSSIERGLKDVRIKTLRRICEKLDVRMRTVVGKAEQ